MLATQSAFITLISASFGHKSLQLAKRFTSLHFHAHLGVNKSSVVHLEAGVTSGLRSVFPARVSATDITDITVKIVANSQIVVVYI